MKLMGKILVDNGRIMDVTVDKLNHSRLFQYMLITSLVNAEILSTAIFLRNCVTILIIKQEGFMVYNLLT